MEVTAMRTGKSLLRWQLTALTFGISLSVGIVAASLVRAQDEKGEKKDEAKTEQKETPKKKEAKPAGRVANDYGIAQVKQINEQISQVWKDNNLNPSNPATDGEWLRRLFLDVLGRVPSVVELKAFVADKSSDKKVKIVNKILEGEEYTEEYARNWTTVWTNLLIGRNGGTENNSMISREGMQKYLRDSFARNKPYDTMVHELVTATGSTVPGKEDFNGATNYLVMKLADDGAQATAMTSKLFLGLQVQCTQCHNHPFNEWKQQKYWEFNAFFRQTRALRKFGTGRDVESTELVNQDYRGESGNPQEADLFYELRNGLTKIAFPVFVDGAEIGRSGFVGEVDRRSKLGDMIVSSEFMDKTMVNRMWSHFLGYGFTKPIDDLGPHNVPSHPELLEYLAKQFRKNSFDTKELIRWIVLSQPYSLSSKTMGGNQSDDPQLGEAPKFSHFYLRQMRAEELYESLVVATEAQKTQGSYEEQEKLKSDWMRQFVTAFGTDDGEETTTFNGTIPQALMLFNGDLIKKATSGEKGGFLQGIANSNLKPADKIDYLFLAGLSRKPTKVELLAANELLAGHKGNMVDALQDMWWAILNSNEFIINH
jgi:hypothetical protein